MAQSKLWGSDKIVIYTSLQKLEFRKSLSRFWTNMEKKRYCEAN